MWRIKYTLGLLLMAHLSAQAQFGNEWIDPAQQYFKFKIAEEGLYRITESELQAAGLNITTIPASRLQVFREGREIAIQVNSNPDGTLSYLEFYGQKRDGTSDTPLYDTGDQPHTYYNLFSDSASYFITYKLGNESGKRMAFSADQNATGLLPEAYHLADTIQLFSTSYGVGTTFDARLNLSQYDKGEGWTGPFIGKSASIDYPFDLINRLTDVPAQLETVLIGGNSQNHNVQISTGTSSPSVLGNATFSGYDFELFAAPIPETTIEAGGSLSVNILAEGFPDVAERISVAYLKVQYAQEVSLGDNTQKRFMLDDVRDRKAWLQIATANAANTRIFDITDPYNVVRMATTALSSRIEVVVSDVSVSHQMLAVTTPKTVGQISLVDLPPYDFSTEDYLIITHPLLHQSPDPVDAYKAYRTSTEGGGYEVAIADIDDIFNVFGFGDPSPLAIRNYLSYAHQQAPLAYVMIIGKGLTLDYDFYRNETNEVNIPTYGLPGTDANYVMGLGGDARIPGIPIGRLNASEPADVSAYLDKVIEMESLPFDDLFRKDFVQLSGGNNEAEINRFKRVINTFSSVLENDFIGGRSFNTSKRTNEFLEYINISERVNEGVGYVTFFGHSSGAYTDIEIGNVSDPAFGYQNKGKYPLFLVNGCKAGEIFGEGATFSEDWILTPELGATGFIAHTSIAYDTDLRDWSSLFYRIGFGDSTFISKSVGEIMVEVSKQYLATYGDSDRERVQLQQMQLHGDPAYRLFNADHPDYALSEDMITAQSPAGGEILASADTFEVALVVKNFGRSIPDSLLVRLSRTFPDGEQEDYLHRVPRPLRQDTFTLKLPLDPQKSHTGSNLVSAQLDPLNEVTELDKTNNFATLAFQIFEGNTLNLFPPNHGTVASSSVNLAWQSSNLFTDERTYELQIDTSASFNSSLLTTLTVTGEVLLQQNFDLPNIPGADTLAFYWRTRAADPSQNESNQWVTSTFTYLSNGTESWGQFEQDQVSFGTLTGIEPTQTEEWRFIQTETPFEIFTFGTASPLALEDSLNNLTIEVNGSNLLATTNTFDRFCEFNTFNAIAFEAQSGLPYFPIEATQIDEFNREVCGRIPQIIYQFREVDVIGPERRFSLLVNNMSDGDKVLLFNMGNVNYSNWDAQMIADFNSLGVAETSIASLSDGQPLIILATKGGAMGSARVLSDNGSLDPITAQTLQLTDVVNGSFTQGAITSDIIGPAASWRSFDYQIIDNTNDAFALNVIGIQADGTRTPILSRKQTETIDISATDPLLYPLLQLAYSFEDEMDRTPPQLDYWQVSYDYPPEGLLLPTSKEVSAYEEGQEISRGYRFINFSPQPFTDSLTVMSTLINQANGTQESQSFKIGPIAAGDTAIFNTSFASFGKVGANTLQVEVQPGENEMYQINNRVTQANIIQVNADETNPVLDVTFDGFHILDGDIVSPEPTISILMRDDNAFLFKTDTIGVTLSMRMPGEGSTFQRIDFSDPRVSYVTASETQDFEVTFVPEPLADGIYGLRVQAEDQSGNDASLVPYEVNFEVINSSSITHFYPYPNPFSTQCRFVFTLTGSAVPDQLKIQILTVSGRVVREITQDEIGPIRIGNNITEYAWDGRDEFGDQLANGVYFYKVILGRSAFTHRQSNADRAFKKGFGKLYILR